MKCCRLEKLGLEPQTAGGAGNERFPFMAFTVPPLKSGYYQHLVRLSSLLPLAALGLNFTGDAFLKDGRKVCSCHKLQTASELDN
jgi:hypothetical protein